MGWNTDEDAYLLQGMKEKGHSFSLAFFVSMLFHTLFLATLLFAPAHKPDTRFSPASVIDVSMVTLPAQAVLESEPAEYPDVPPEKETEPEEPFVAEPVSEPEKPEESVPAEPEEILAKEQVIVTPESPAKEQVVIKPETPEEDPKPKEKPITPEEVKQETPKKETKPEKVVKTHKTPDKRVANSKKALAKPPQAETSQATASRTETVANAIDRLRKKLRKKDAKPAPETGKVGKSQNAPGTATSSGMPGAGHNDVAAIRFYRDNVIPDRINKNWALSEHLLGRRFGLRAILVIRIVPNGQIRDIWFEKVSGDKYFDDSVRKAVMKSNPLPPLPRDFSDPFYEVELVFTPSGLN